jgi:hypothetical protein
VVDADDDDWLDGARFDQPLRRLIDRPLFAGGRRRSVKYILTILQVEDWEPARAVIPVARRSIHQQRVLAWKKARAKSRVALEIPCERVLHGVLRRGVVGELLPASDGAFLRTRQ